MRQVVEDTEKCRLVGLVLRYYTDKIISKSHKYEKK